VSYFEWVQNRNGMSWTLEEVHERLADIMRREFSAVHELAGSLGVDLRRAAYAHALSRLGAAIACQGTQAWFRGAKDRGTSGY
jgi:glutamate dehydrogenase (NADP+)